MLRKTHRKERGLQMQRGDHVHWHTLLCKGIYSGSSQLFGIHGGMLYGLHREIEFGILLGGLSELKMSRRCTLLL